MLLQMLEIPAPERLKTCDAANTEPSTRIYRNAAGFCFDKFVEIILIIKINHVPVSVFVLEGNMKAKIVLETVF